MNVASRESRANGIHIPHKIENFDEVLGSSRLLIMLADANAHSYLSDLEDVPSKCRALIPGKTYENVLVLVLEKAPTIFPGDSMPLVLRGDDITRKLLEAVSSESDTSQYIGIIRKDNDEVIVGRVGVVCEVRRMRTGTLFERRNQLEISLVLLGKHRFLLQQTESRIAPRLFRCTMEILSEILGRRDWSNRRLSSTHIRLRNARMPFPHWIYEMTSARNLAKRAFERMVSTIPSLAVRLCLFSSQHLHLFMLREAING